MGGLPVAAADAPSKMSYSEQIDALESFINLKEEQKKPDLFPLPIRAIIITAVVLGLGAFLLN